MDLNYNRSEDLQHSETVDSVSRCSRSYLLMKTAIDELKKAAPLQTDKKRAIRALSEWPTRKFNQNPKRYKDYRMLLLLFQLLLLLLLMLCCCCLIVIW